MLPCMWESILPIYLVQYTMYQVLIVEASETGDVAVRAFNYDIMLLSLFAVVAAADGKCHDRSAGFLSCEEIYQAYTWYTKANKPTEVRTMLALNIERNPLLL